MAELFTFLLLFETANFKPLTFIQGRRYKDVLGAESSLECANIFCQPASESDHYTQSYKLSKMSDRKNAVFRLFRYISGPGRQTKHIQELSRYSYLL